MSVYNPAVLNALTFDWTRKKADIDSNENRYRINYNSALDKMRRAMEDTSLRSREGLADRGMTHSGPALTEGVKLQDEYNRQQATAAESVNLNLTELARKRLELDQEYNIQKLLASLGYEVK